ncbi:chaperone DnaJ-domain superfamily protein [Striga asiatica]|uniref:Chaperone DnaJ-domain superfamily protein n=1 Tax=Striga asiatica TaxID=4170 RepID=A0A5A7Q520_STRAF|nr:chaperone DnaJ-domain superfamily protein [Striga asiatica]
MDEFGVLVESIGFRAHGKSAPMAKLKPKPKSHIAPNVTANAPSYGDPYSLPVDELDGIFRSNVNISKARQSQNAFVDDNIFGGPVSSASQYGGIDLESVFSSSNKRNSADSYGFDDLLGSNSKMADPVDDLFGNFGLSSSGNQGKNDHGLDDLIPGFGGAATSKNRVHPEAKSNWHPSMPRSTGIDDPFLIFESSASQSDASWLFNEPSSKVNVKSSVQSTANGFDNFFMDGPPESGSKVVRNTANKPSSGTSSNGFENADYFDAIFGGSNAGQTKSAKQSSTAQNSSFDDFFHQEVPKNTSSKPTFSTKKAPSATNIGNDFTSLFGDLDTSSGEFHEIEGEPAERRKARLKRHMKMNERMAEALAEKNQRDLQIQYEQEEKRRLAETLDNDIKRWASGKESNLRALLSSLQQVLGPESGWRPVSLTDMITSESVKKVYKKATLYVHPDKVQQRGANLQQKYVAEQVFDILKEASNKFSAEELR